MKKRWFGDVRIDSKWEKELAETLFSKAIFKPEKIKYKIPKTYTADFLIMRHKAIDQNTKRLDEMIYVECKGRFRDREEASKYLYIRDSLPSIAKLVFVFYDPSKPMPFAKKRKDGTKQTHAEWASLNNFEWYTAETFPKDWLKEM